MVTGLEAVRGWAWRAVDTAWYRFSVFSWSFGCELEALVRADTKRSEAERYVREALLVSPYSKRRVAEPLHKSKNGQQIPENLPPGKKRFVYCLAFYIGVTVLQQLG